MTPDEQDEFFAAVLGAFKQKAVRQKNPPPVSLPGNRQMPRSVVLDIGRTIAVAELFTHMDTIVDSFVHQQISRYPTRIDGVDSRKIYMDHRDDVKSLLRRIYATSKTLSKQLECKAPLAIQSKVAVSADMQKFMPP